MAIWLQMALHEQYSDYTLLLIPSVFTLKTQPTRMKYVLNVLIYNLEMDGTVVE